LAEKPRRLLTETTKELEILELVSHLKSEKYSEIRKQAASWLLTGTVQFDRSTNSKILPHWLPVASKARGALNSDGFLHLIANGDQYFSDYVKAPGQNMASTLPRRTDPAAYVCQEFARDALVSGKPFDALKTDIAGAEATEI
jgi:hypothetical protein